ncbi:MAG: LysM peptidoglycan-binding domain-containing protein [Thermodesulfobacteriota bacterium]
MFSRNSAILIILFLFLYGCAHPLNLLSDRSGDESDPSKNLPTAVSESSDMDPETESAGFEADAYLDEKVAETADILPVLSEKIQPELDESLEYCQIAQDFWQKGELENALEALDYAYSLILKVDSEDDAKLMQQKEDLRFMISKRILEIYASRNIVVSGQHNAIPVEINKYVQKEIDFLSRGNYLQRAMKRAGRYRPYILEELRKAGLPEELSWLPLIESGYRVDAFSPARALGLWQFIPSTGYKFGLKRDRYVDERIDPEKSTLAAIAYLKELHQIFGDWATVLAAYNCGEGRVLRVIRTQNVNYLDNFWDLFERLPRETARYVPRFIATMHMINHPEKYGIDNVTPDTPPEYETLTVSKKACLNSIAKAAGISESVLRDLNPELKQHVLPPRTYSLRVPVGKGATLLSKLAEVPVYNAPKTASNDNIVYHRVRKGQSLSTIAGRYGVRISTIMRANNIHRKNYVVAGKILKIPVSPNSRHLAQSRKAASERASIVHVVKRGDSLWNLARQYGTTTKQIKALNRLSGSRLSIGQKLKIVSKTGQGNDGLKTYLVRNGDIPFEIAKRHNMSLEAFLKVNKLSRYSKIYPGQKVYVE